MSQYRFRKSNNNRNINKRQITSRKRALNYYHVILRDYIYGLAHPELAVNSSNIPKAPNYVSIPTSSITFREAFDIVPDVNGEFILYWTPNFLATKEQILNRTGLPNYSRNWLGTFNDEHNEFGYYPVAAYSPPASFVKYRLVSAGCKITYKGPVIERAGIISHCLTYRAIPMPYFREDQNDWISQNALESAVDLKIWGNQLKNLDPTTIQNGMWNAIQNVQKNQTVFVCAVPTDPSDMIFEDDGYFYQAATAQEEIPRYPVHYDDANGHEVTTNMALQLPEDGTPCSYIFKGTDLTKDAKLYVEQFYNFEVIPTEESAPILRPRKDELSSSQKEQAKEIINKALDKTKGITTKITNNLIEDLLSLDSDYQQNEISNQPQPYNRPRNVKKNKVAKNNFWTKAKNFGNSVVNEAKGVLKDVANVAFTKENAFKLGQEIANMLINQK